MQARYDLAVEAIKTFHTGVSEDFLLKEEKFKELRNRLLKSASDFYGKLGALLGKETDLASRRALAQANFELADLPTRSAARRMPCKAHRWRARRAGVAGGGAGGRRRGDSLDVGRSLTAVAGLLGATGKTDEAVAAYRRSEALLAGLAGSDATARAALAEGRSRLGELLSNTGKAEEALHAYQAGAGRPGGARRAGALA